jgi:hypothetical protein
MTQPIESIVADDAGANGTALQELQRRVQALEEAVARLENPRIIEQRITERLAQLPTAKPPPPPELPPVSAFTIEPPLSWGGRWASWLFVDMWREARTLVTLIFDRRYAMAWTSRLVVLVVLPLMLTSHWWLTFLLCGFPWVDGLRGILIAAVNLVLAFALYKALSREVRRYNEYARR